MDPRTPLLPSDCAQANGLTSRLPQHAAEFFRSRRPFAPLSLTQQLPDFPYRTLICAESARSGRRCGAGFQPARF